MVDNDFSSYFKKWRKDNNLTQKEVARMLKVTEFSVLKWENGKERPAERFLFIISNKTGYKFKELNNNISTFGSLLKKKRLEKGLSRRALGEKLGYNSLTVMRWENNKSKPYNFSLEVICDYFKLEENECKRLLKES